MPVLPFELQVTASVLGIISTAAGLVTLLFIPTIRRRIDRRHALDRFLRDWAGEDEVPGRDRVPGVMERLNRLDGELKRNGGSTMKDAVYRIEETATKLATTQEEHGKHLASLTDELRKVTQRQLKTEQRLTEHDDHLSAHDTRTPQTWRKAQ